MDDREFRSELGRLVAQASAGLAVRAAAAFGIVYAGVHAYHWLVHVFDPVRHALG